jgi:signal peptidase I
MSLVLPGFGQLYNGQINKAIWVFVLFTFIVLEVGALVAMFLPDSWLITCLVIATIDGIALWIWNMVDAWRHAKKLQLFALKSWQISGTYLAALIACGLFALPLTYSFVRGQWIEPFHIPSSSMEPSILMGDYLLADKRYNCPNCKHAVKRGDIAIFTYPNDRTFYYIKRIVALPGDEVTIEGKTVTINGVSLSIDENTEQWGQKKWQVQWSNQPAMTTAKPTFKVTVPAGNVFVLGDNRDLTKDSRAFGTVPLQDVVGRARQVWFSKSADGIRWQRLGKVLDER